ncbi:hypothetical protein KGP36_05600 [Patescibacteria group bacterium]|nr:hypothetical protein [Patescibacteria group bacterium]
MPIEHAVASLIDQFNSFIIPHAFQVGILVAPVALAILLGTIFWELWVDYVQGKQFLGLKYAVLELKLPKETNKSPLAMEVVLTAVHNTSDGSFYARYWKGETRPWYSLELVSIEGNVKFYMWTEDRRKVNLMSALYSQYPGIEIKEVEDYARSIHFDPKTMKMWADEFELTQKDPWPIKTYVDYGLDKDPKEELKVDPMSPLLEFLGSVGPNQQVWFQIPIIAHKKEKRDPSHFFKRFDEWKEKHDKLKNEILLRDPKTKVAGHTIGESPFPVAPAYTKGETEGVAALERHVLKYAFDCGIRAAYIAKKDAFNPPFGIGGCVGSMKHFGAEGYNGFKPNSKRWIQQFEYPWQDFMDVRRNRQSRLFLMAYKRRSFFYGPFKSPRLTLNSEELATIYHFPGSVAQTPTLERVPSKKAQAPVNLPV